MVWKGVIIEESLEDKTILNAVKIVDIRESTLENEDKKGILHFHNIQLDDKEKDEFVRRAVSAIKQGWYIHICKDNIMTIIFKGKYFSFTFNKAEIELLMKALNKCDVMWDRFRKRKIKEMKVSLK